MHVLPVVEIAVALRKLGRAIDEVAAEEQIVARRYGESVSHEDGAVARESERHPTRDAMHFLAEGQALKGSDGEASTHISGSLVSMSVTAAMGMPKLLAGPQKSVVQAQRLAQTMFVKPVHLDGAESLRA